MSLLSALNKCFKHSTSGHSIDEAKKNRGTAIIGGSFRRIYIERRVLVTGDPPTHLSLAAVTHTAVVALIG